MLERLAFERAYKRSRLVCHMFLRPYMVRTIYDNMRSDTCPAQALLLRMDRFI